MEYLIKRTDGEWFDFHKNRFEEILRPRSFPSITIVGWGNHRIEVAGCEISFSFEDPGIQVIVENINIPAEQIEQLVQEICQNIAEKTGQQGIVISL